MDWTRWPNFSKAEMACRCCGQAKMDPAFMDALQALREAVGEPLPVSSAYRCPAHNRRVGGGPEHPLGKAVDLRISGALARRVIGLATAFPRLGIKQTGAHEGRFVHLGTGTAEDGLPSPTVWSY